MENWKVQPDIVPNVVFKTRVRDDSIEGPNPYRWQERTSFDYFANKRVVLFSLPGAFTPTCSTYQLPDFEKLHLEFYDEGIDEVISTRRLCHIVQTFSIFNKRDKAIALCVNRFDEDTKEAFIDLYEKVDATINAPEEEEAYVEPNFKDNNNWEDE